MLRAIAFALMAFLLRPAAVAADVPRAGDAAVKAAVMYNLLLFVQWPESAQKSAFQFCLLNDSELGTALRGKERATVNGRPLQVRLVAPVPEELDNCAAVVVEAGNPGLLARLAVYARQKPLLILGEGPNAVERGAMIGVYSDGGRVTFDIHLGQMRRSQLGASAKILRLARQVSE